LKDLDIMSKSDPQVEVYMKDRTQRDWAFVGRTEVQKNNLNPDFTKYIESDYYFEREQNVRFMVYDVDASDKDFIGKNETTIANIIGSVR
jgi:Ca2+-dependent lipid-binding protein